MSNEIFDITVIERPEDPRKRTSHWAPLIEALELTLTTGQAISIPTPKSEKGFRSSIQVQTRDKPWRVRTVRSEDKKTYTLWAESRPTPKSKLLMRKKDSKESETPPTMSRMSPK